MRHFGAGCDVLLERPWRGFALEFVTSAGGDSVLPLPEAASDHLLHDLCEHACVLPRWDRRVDWHLAWSPPLNCGVLSRRDDAAPTDRPQL
jgi:hypothetical protein